MKLVTLLTDRPPVLIRSASLRELFWLEQESQLNSLPDGEEYEADRDTYRDFEESVKGYNRGAYGAWHQQHNHESDTRISECAPLYAQRNAYRSYEDNSRCEDPDTGAEVEVSHCSDSCTGRRSCDILDGNRQRGAECQLHSHQACNRRPICFL